jgi:S-formylglutathione hydrolase
MQGVWSRVLVAGKFADVYDPPAAPRSGILFLHGTDEETLVARPAFTRLFDELNLACVCPLAGQSWWTDRIWREFDEAVSAERYLLNAAVPYFAERWKIGPSSIGLLGVDMGGQGALRLAFKHPDVFPVVAALAPVLEFHELIGRGTPLDELYDSKEQARQDTAILHIHPSRFPRSLYFAIDPTDEVWFRGCDRLHEKLNALGAAHEADLSTTGGGHSWTYINRAADRALRFLQSSLARQGLRLV